MGYWYSSHQCNNGCEEPHGYEHRDNCTCEACHGHHIEDGIELFDGYADCCTDHINYLIAQGEWCDCHRKSWETHEEANNEHRRTGSGK